MNIHDAVTKGILDQATVDTMKVVTNKAMLELMGPTVTSEELAKTILCLVRLVQWDRLPPVVLLEVVGTMLSQPSLGVASTFAIDMRETVEADKKLKAAERFGLGHQN